MEAADPDQLAESYAPDGVPEEVGFAATYTGRDAIRDDESVFLAAFTDVLIKVSNAFASGNQAAAEWSFAGTYTGAIPGVPPGAGQTVAFRGSSILLFGPKGIIRHTQYFDVYSILVQFGALPAPDAGAGQPTPTPAG
jgi:predicted ester cyclase